MIAGIILAVSQEVKNASEQSKTAEFIDAFCAKRANDSQTNAIFWLVDALDQAVHNKDSQQVNTLSAHLSWVFEQVKACNKTAEFIDALCAKRANGSQTNTIFWLVDALKQSNSVDTHAIITKVIIELIICIDNVFVPEEFSTLIFTHKDSLKKSIILQLKKIQDTVSLKKITDKTTLLGRLLDHKTSSISSFFKKEIDARDQVNKLIAEKEIISSLSTEQLMYLLEVGADALGELSSIQLFELGMLGENNVNLRL